jgi:hypothetical protein
VIALFVKPDPLSVPVMDLPLTVAVKFKFSKLGADKVSPTDGAEKVPVTVTAIDVAPTSVPVPLTVPDVSANTRFNVNGVPLLVVELPLQVPATVAFGPLESPLQAARPRRRQTAASSPAVLIDLMFMEDPR